MEHIVAYFNNSNQLWSTRWYYFRTQTLNSFGEPDYDHYQAGQLAVVVASLIRWQTEKVQVFVLFLVIRHVQSAVSMWCEVDILHFDLLMFSLVCLLHFLIYCPIFVFVVMSTNFLLCFRFCSFVSSSSCLVMFQILLLYFFDSLLQFNLSFFPPYLFGFAVMFLVYCNFFLVYCFSFDFLLYFVMYCCVFFLLSYF